MVEISPRFRAPPANRPSTHINRKPASNFWHAFNVAKQRGLPLTLHISINFAHTGCPASYEAQALCTLLSRYFGPWWRRPSRKTCKGPVGPCAYVWVMEAGGGHTNAHLLMHMPDNRLSDFMTRFPKWIAAVTGGRVGANAVKYDGAYNPNGLRLYLLKGADPAYCKWCDIEHRPQGVVIGKRSGFSRSLGPTERQRIGYRPKRRYYSPA